MKKLRLEIDTLVVESFATDASQEGKGTVRAHGPNDTAPGAFTCGAVQSCGPNTCGNLYCVLETDNYYCATGAATCAGCGPGPGGNPSGQMSCVGCTTYDYTAVRADSCDLCMSFYTDSPQRCPCI
jgi:hypothetical protein